MKRVFLTIILNIMFGVISYSMVVYDPTNHAESILQRIEGVKRTIEVIKQTQNQLQQLKYEAMNLANLDKSLSNSQLIGLQQNFQSILDIQSKMNVQIRDFKNFQENLKNVYTSSENLKNLKTEEYINHADKIMEQSRSVAEDGLRMAGIANPKQMQNNAQKIKALMSAANTVEGQKAALQANIQMSGMSYQLLNELKLLLSQSLVTQNTILMADIQNNKIAEAKYNNLMNTKIDVDRMNSGALKLLTGAKRRSYGG